MGCAVRGRGGRRDQRAAAPLRAHGPDEPRRRRGPGARHATIQRRHGWRRRCHAAHRGRSSQQRKARGSLRRAEADAEARQLRLGVRPGGGRDVQRHRVRHVSLSLMPTTAPPRSEVASPAPLVGRLGAALAMRGVSYGQWKGHGKRERWESGRGDIDLLVDRAAWADFADVLAGLGFKLALPPPGREAAGILHYFGLDERTGQLIHVHAYQRLVVGLPWRTHYRLPLERALLDSATQQAVFKTPAPELEIVVLVLRLSLRHALTDPLRRTPPRWLDGALPELDRLEDQATPEAVRAALARHFPEVSVTLFERCRHALRGDYSPWRRLAVRVQLARALAAHASRPPVFALAERVWQRVRPLGQRLAGGGSVVALLGGDGSGKSTYAEALDAWLGSSLATLHLQLGRPPRSLTTLVVGAALKIAQGVGAPPRIVAHLELLRSGCTARDRYRVYRRARRFATGGGAARWR